MVVDGVEFTVFARAFLLAGVSMGAGWAHGSSMFDLAAWMRCWQSDATAPQIINPLASHESEIHTLPIW